MLMKTRAKQTSNIITNIIVPEAKRRKCDIYKVISPKTVSGLITLQQSDISFHTIKRMTKDIMKNKISLGQAIIKEFFT